MKSVLVIGLGRFGRHMAMRLLQEGNSVMAVDISEERADAAASVIPNIEILDARDEEVVSSLGVNNFDFCVVAIGDDFQSALEIVVLLKDYGAKYIVARATRDVHQKLLLRNGADYVVYAEKDMAERLAVRFGVDNIFDYIQLSGDMGIYEIKTPTAWRGRTIRELSIRTAYNVNILGAKRGEEITPMLEADYVFNAEDSLLVMGSQGKIRKIAREK